MKILLKSVAAAGLALAATVSIAVPAQAQVAGIASSSPESVILRSAARIAGYEAINTTYASQIAQITTIRQEIQTLSQSLDTNKDSQVDQAEADANPAILTQVEQKQAQVDTLSQPIGLAQYFVIEQLLADYGNAETQVIQDKSIQIMLSPEAFQYAADGVDVTDAILAVVNQRLPAVQTIPPAGFRPRQQTAQMHQTIQQIIINIAQRAAIQQAQQQQAATPAPAPTGR